MLSLLPLLLLIVCTRAQNGLEICISNPIAEECPGYYGRYSENKRQVRLNPDRIRVVDARTGRDVKSVRLPGQYTLSFDDITISGSKPLEFLVGDLSVDLVDVPIFGSIPAVPAFAALPNFGRLLRGDRAFRTCDDPAHEVQVDEKACRFCDLCQIGGELESELNKGRHKYIPHLSREGHFGSNCSRFFPGERYSIQRTISLPDPGTLQGDLPNVEQQLAKAFREGQGRLLVRLRLLNKVRASSSSNNQFGCSTHRWCGSLLPRSDPRCQCNQGDPIKAQCQQSNGYMPDYDLAACYNIEFHYSAKEIDPRTSQSVCRQQTQGGGFDRTIQSSFFGPEESGRQQQGREEDSRCPTWCCARPRNFITDYGCPADCVFRPESHCNIPLFN